MNFIELFSYIFIRVFIFSYNIYIGLHPQQFGNSYFYCVFPLYIMGLVWSKELVKGFINNFRDTLL